MNWWDRLLGFLKNGLLSLPPPKGSSKAVGVRRERHVRPIAHRRPRLDSSLGGRLADDSALPHLTPDQTITSDMGGISAPWGRLLPWP